MAAESEDIEQPTTRAHTWRDLLDWTVPPDDAMRPRAINRWSVFVVIFIPWLIMYECVVYRGPAAWSFSSYLPGEWSWPIWQWTEVLYTSAYVLVTIAPLIAPTNRVLRRFVIGSMIGVVAGMLLFLLLPATSMPRPFEPHGVLGRMMQIDRDLDRNNGSASLPSFHVVWSFFGAAVFAECARGRRVLVALCWLWATAVSASCVLTGMHSIIDVVAGFVTFLVIQRVVTSRWLSTSAAD
jgi:membrane-associated phospholipid phosphatase